MEANENDGNLKDVLGINIADEVMPTSDIQAMLFPT